MSIESNARFETSEEVQTRMAEYQAKVIGMVEDLFPRPGMPRPRAIPALSDEDKGNEWKAQREYYTALGVFRTTVEKIIPLTDLRGDALRDQLNALDDETPDAIAWSEAIGAGGLK